MGWLEYAKKMEDFCNHYRITDSHVHIGTDVDGKTASIEDHLEYELFGINERVIFPFNEVDKAKTKPFYGLANKRIATIAELYKDSVIGFFRLYPPDFSSSSEVRKEMEKWMSHGLKGVKLRPGSRGDEYDVSIIGDFLKVAGTLDLPVIVHSDDKDNNANGSKLVKMANRYRGTNVIVAHMGKTDKSPMMLSEELKLDNVYWDLSVSLDMNIGNFTHALRNLGPEKIIFGSDYPYRNPLITLQKLNYVSNMKLYESILDQTNLQKILSDNIHNLIEL